MPIYATLYASMDISGFSASFGYSPKKKNAKPDPPAVGLSVGIDEFFVLAEMAFGSQSPQVVQRQQPLVIKSPASRPHQQHHHQRLTRSRAASPMGTFWSKA